MNDDRQQQQQQQRVVWRAMTAADLPAVFAIANAIHLSHFERLEVLAEKQTLYPPSNFVACFEHEERLIGYAMGHPYVRDQICKLDTLMGKLPEPWTVMHMHDVALLPEARGSGAGLAIVDQFVDIARQLSLSAVTAISVNGTAGLWAKKQFAVRHDLLTPDQEIALTKSYGQDSYYMIREL